MKHISWTEEYFRSELLDVCQKLGRFPVRSDLIGLGLEKLRGEITRRGGHTEWCKKMGYPPVNSDTHTGWEGEKEVMGFLESKGYFVERMTRLSAPYDLVVNRSLRIDVKSARYAEYGPCRGWFYRVGKVVSSDALVLYQLDTKEFYFLPWFICPITNITISRSGGKYREYRNNLKLLKSMLSVRSGELVKMNLVPQSER